MNKYRIICHQAANKEEQRFDFYTMEITERQFKDFCEKLETKRFVGINNTLVAVSDIKRIVKL